MTIILDKQCFGTYIYVEGEKYEGKITSDTIECLAFDLNLPNDTTGHEKCETCGDYNWLTKYIVPTEYYPIFTFLFKQ